MANNLPLDSSRAPTLTRTSVAAAVGLALTAGLPLAHAAPPVPGAALGDEFRINSHTSGSQSTPVVAMDAAGDFVVVWTDSSGGDGDGDGIFAQRYHAGGAPDGSAFQVNTYPSGDQVNSAVAMDAAGDFVVVWEDDSGKDGDSYGVFARRFKADGTAVTDSEFQVSTHTPGKQAAPAVAMDAAGDFVVAWEDNSAQDGDGYGVFARSYKADGTPDGSEFQVNTHTSSTQRHPAVAMDVAGDFVVAWDDFGHDGDSYGVFARRYHADGTSDGSAFQVNTHTFGFQRSPAVAMDAAGDFVVAWKDKYSGFYTVAARRYKADGTPDGSAFQIKTYTSNSQRSPTVAMDATGDFVVVWEDDSGYDGDARGIFARSYHADSTPAGSGFQVNAHTFGDQAAPAVVMDAAGDFVVAWEDDSGQDGDGDGVFARRYARGSSLDLKAILAIAPADTVEPGSDLTVTATIANVEAPSTLTGNATIDNALTAASGLTVTLTFPDGITFGKVADTHWTCPAAPAKDSTLTCTYDASLAAASETENLTVNLTAPDTDGAKLAFSNAVFGAQPDAVADNNTAGASITVQASPPPPSDDDSGDGGDDSGGADTPPPASSSGGGGGNLGWLGLGLLGLIGLRRRT